MKMKKVEQIIRLNKTLRKNWVSLGLTFLVCCTIFTLCAFISCTKYQQPGMIYDTSVKIDTSTSPVITRVSPGSIAVGGVREINIFGRNLGLKNGTDTNWIYIAGLDLKSSIKTITDTMISLYRPALATSKYDKVVVLNITDPKAVAKSAAVQYTIGTPGGAFGAYGGTSGTFNASVIGILDFDNQDNAYVLQSALMVKIDATGISQTIVYGVPAKSPALADYRAATDFKFAPSGNGPMGLIASKKASLYCVRLDSAIFQKISPTGLTGNIIKFDYDSDGLIYAADAAGSIWKIDMTGADTTATKLGTSDYTNIKEVHITGGYFYATDGVTIKKSQISNGDLGTASILVDLTTLPDLSNLAISSFAIDENQNLFICLGNSGTATGGLPNYSIYYKENGSSIIEPYYRDQTILPNTVEHIIWGHSNNLYLLSNSLKDNSGAFAAGRIFKMVLDRNGAPSKERTF